MGILADIRSSTAQVMERARFVRIHDRCLGELADELAKQVHRPLDPDAARHFVGEPDAVLAYTICLDAVNFGSGWFPCMKKRPGCSGYFTVSTSLADHFRAHGAWTAEDLTSLDGPRCSAIFGQDSMAGVSAAAGESAASGKNAAASESAAGEISELMALFARSLNDLGELLIQRYQGSFVALVGAADRSAEGLIELLAGMPLYRDVSPYGELNVPFYKRAQITSADLSLAFGGQGHGEFHDLADLTLFADNLIPHVLRMEGVLEYDLDLLGRIESGELIEHDSPEEVEMRAAAVQVVERMVERLRTSARGEEREIDARTLDHWLWYRGQSPGIKASPRHRSRTPAY